jgi:deazaflavin-dependent oxidoreductase (nitroreductase family)
VSELNDWNTKVIDEFRSNQGRVGQFEGAPLLLLTTKGAKTGETRVNPVMYLVEDGVTYVFGSFAGDPKNPAWYHNLVAHPQVTVEKGTETYDATARVITGADRDRVYAIQAGLFPTFAEYQEKTSRVIPVVALEPAS